MVVILRFHFVLPVLHHPSHPRSVDQIMHDADRNGEKTGHISWQVTVHFLSTREALRTQIVAEVSVEKGAVESMSRLTPPECTL